MAKSLTPSKEDKLLDKIKTKYDSAKSIHEENYERGRKDNKFVYGDQWDERIKGEREAEMRPCITQNILLSYVHQVINNIRQSNPTIIPKPVDSNSDPETAEILQGLIKNIETVNDGDVVYDTAAKNAITSGIGWIRVKTDYADYNSFDQEIKLERVLDPFSVLLDPNSQKIDGSDAEYAFVYEDIDIKDFEDMYPDARIEGFTDKEWGDTDTVRIVEYYYKHYEEKTLVLLDTGEKKYKDEVIEGEIIVQERTVKDCKIKYCKATQIQILEKGEFAGRYIPLVPVYGEEAWKDGKRQLYSMIHQAKDAQRMLNYWKSASTEIIALQPKASWVGYTGSFSSKARQWATANVKNHAFLEADPVYDKNGMVLPAPTRVNPPQGSAAMLQEAAMAVDGVKSVLGMFDASMGSDGTEISGKAIISRQMQGDNANFHFIDNLSHSMRHVGRIIIDLIPIIYSSDRVIRILGVDEQEKLVPINQNFKKEGNDYRVAESYEKPDGRFDLTTGKYDVIVEVGQSYATRRQEAANAIIEIARVNPEILNVAGDILVRNLDVPNADELAKRIRATMDPSLLGDDVEAQRLQQMTQGLQQLQQKLEQTEAALKVKDDNQQFKNQLELEKIKNDKQKIEIDALKTMAEISKLNAETQQEIPAQAMNDYADAMSKLEGRMQDMYEALDIILTSKEGELATGEPESPAIQTEKTDDD